jgi:hypothetical protein
MLGSWFHLIPAWLHDFACMVVSALAQLTQRLPDLSQVRRALFFQHIMLAVAAWAQRC